MKALFRVILAVNEGCSMAGEQSKSLKGLDAFQAQVLEFLAKLANNPKILGYGFGGLLVVLVGAYGVRYGIQKSHDKVAEGLVKVDAIFEEENKSFQKLREAKEKERDALRAALPSDAGEKGLDTPEIKALDAEIQALKPDHSKSSGEYKAFYEKHPKAAEGLVAGLKYASFAAEQGQLEDAQKVLEAMVEPAKDFSVLKIQTYFLLVSVLEDRDQLDKALEYTEKFLNGISSELKPKLLLSKGQILLLKKDFTQAQATLNQIVSEFETSAEAERARSLLALIPL
jgi:predicted negative regulator of RcsB-dependent stress response